MKLLRLYIILAISCLLSPNTYSQTTKINADSLIINVDKYLNKTVEIEGRVVHVCGVSCRKLKLKTSTGVEIMVIPNKSLPKFDLTLKQKNIRVVGMVKELRLDNAYVDKLEKEEALLCSIDKMACQDSAWIKIQKQKGTASEASKQAILNLRKRIEKSGKAYLSVVTLVANKIELIE